jgi:hypothetical protein
MQHWIEIAAITSGCVNIFFIILIVVMGSRMNELYEEIGDALLKNENLKRIMNAYTATVEARHE